MMLHRMYPACCALALMLACTFAGASEVGVVVLHGKWGSPERAVDSLAAALRGDGYLVSVPEMPWSRGRQYDVDVPAAGGQIDGEIAKLRDRGAKRVFMIGHSMGANFALHYASRASDTLAGVIGIAPGHRPESVVYARAFEGDISEARALVAAGKGAQAISFKDLNTGNRAEAKRATAVVFLSYFDPDGPLNLARNVKALKADIPVLWIVPTGEDSRLRAGTLAMYAALPPNARHRFAEPDADHLGSPAASVRPVLDWIRQIAASN